MNLTIIIPAVIITFLVIVSVFIYWYMNKNKYRYIFKLISRDGISTRTLKGKLVPDIDNPRIKKFAFKDNGSLLSVKEPDGHEDGKPIRRVTFNSEGEYVYLEGYKFDEQNYLKASLTPKAKELSLFQMQANQRRNPIVNKVELAALISGIILFIIILGGVVFMMVKFVKTTDNMVNIANDNKESIIAMNSYVDVLLEANKIFLGASNNLAGYCSGFTDQDFSSSNITRSLESQQTS